MVSKIIKKKWYNKWWVWVIITLAILILFPFFLELRFIEKGVKTTSPESNLCIPNWQCSNWSECNSSGIQARRCVDLNNCGTTYGKPFEIQNCTPLGKGGVYFKGETSIIYAGFGSYYVVGELLNNGTRSYKNYEIQLVVDLYKGNQLVDTDFGFPTTDLPAGGTASFKILLLNPPEFDSYKIKISIISI